MGALRFELRDTPPDAPALRAELRAFLAEQGRNWSPTVRAYSWMGFDRDFSREVGKRGWIGMTWPRAYGGGERTAMDRYVVLEEMLAVGAPVGAHWIGDRQSGPLILRLGTEEQRREFLPRIVSGELAFAIGLSEPDSGSDLASLRTRATKVEGGWRIEGRKVWTTNAHRCDFMIALLRTSPAPDPRAKHQGLSQFLVDLRSSGLSIRPILDLAGEEGFNEITFDNVFVPDSLLVGKEGNGWEQATAELAFERAGPERYLSSLPLLTAALDDLRAEPAAAETVGRLLARAGTLRQMSLSVAGMLQEGKTPAREAALVKDVGNDYEQALPETLRTLFDAARTPAEVWEMQRMMTMVARSYSLRGGTREILRGIIARQLGLR
ncbi:acyl-CoA dehydrogenase family protein [Siccirubricoccus sp. KC 17139]|uniref:Acyl-CoA dehydrogenase family protein n=1 Tax=Siccirubricoccus soli TaxID=2899147 RepID=A0ABT1CY86_9PROT|nr:acyl-CoA dehydrogenase family protein [Siccirubricoccus soli]MCO6414618.1 acyl-CoA dehydrogenase family protein [Siccirubricoccus soli]MCP2680748.1 acyl-CoA dehydrogenase family protein [Siccirubricoccus soli]